MGEQFRTSDGMSIRYDVTDFTTPWKKPETMVLLHAAMGSRNRFHQWMPHLVGRMSWSDGGSRAPPCPWGHWRISA